jgi:hypothetical protein
MCSVLGLLPPIVLNCVVLFSDAPTFMLLVRCCLRLLFISSILMILYHLVSQWRTRSRSTPAYVSATTPPPPAPLEAEEEAPPASNTEEELRQRLKNSRDAAQETLSAKVRFKHLHS